MFLFSFLFSPTQSLASEAVCCLPPPSPLFLPSGLENMSEIFLPFPTAQQQQLFNFLLLLLLPGATLETEGGGERKESICHCSPLPPPPSRQSLFPFEDAPLSPPFPLSTSGIRIGWRRGNGEAKKKTTKVETDLPTYVALFPFVERQCATVW